MSADVYQVLSLGMRYVFTALGVLIVLRAFLWLRRDRRAKHERLRRLPDAGMVGELVTLSGSPELPEGVCVAVPREGTLGALRGCDVCVPVTGVAPEHLDLQWQDRRGLCVTPLRGRSCRIDGEEVSHARPGWMGHGATLYVGEAVLRLRLFEGLEAEYHARVRDFEDAPPEAEDWAEKPDFGREASPDPAPSDGGWEEAVP